jgi:hypothetical protein
MNNGSRCSKAEQPFGSQTCAHPSISIERKGSREAFHFAKSARMEDPPGQLKLNGQNRFARRDSLCEQTQY